MMAWTTMTSPIGELVLLAEDGRLREIGFGNSNKPRPGVLEDRAPFEEIIRQLTAYFSGAQRTFTLPLAPQGTPFQQRVWQALLKIPYGSTASYRDIAVSLGNPNAVRAVGLANGRNPIPVIIPCHRVIGSNGSLTGYAGGLEIKKRLLDLEGAAYRA